MSLHASPPVFSEAHVARIAAVLSGNMNITGLSGEVGSMDDRGMSDLAEMGRMEARTKRQQSATPHPGLARYDGWGFPYDCSDSGIAILPVPGTLRRTWGLGHYSGATGYDGLWTQLMQIGSTRGRARVCQYV